MARLSALTEPGVDSLLAPLSLATRCLVKRAWLRERPEVAVGRPAAIQVLYCYLS